VRPVRTAKAAKAADCRSGSAVPGGAGVARVNGGIEVAVAPAVGCSATVEAAATAACSAAVERAERARRVPLV